MFDPLWAALLTLTRVPAPCLAARPNAAIIGGSAALYPLVGAALGVGAAGIDFFLGPYFPREILVLIVLAFWAILTGALHEDGLADVFDAFGSQNSRGGILRVLKDSRIGAYGVLALVLVTFLRWQGLSAIPNGDFLVVLIAVQTLPRAGIVALAYFAGPAAEGTGGEFARAMKAWHVLAAAVLSAAIVGPVLGIRTVGPALACLGTVAILGTYFRRRLGGVTGDCLGAANQLQEVAILLALLAAAGPSAASD